MIGRSRGEPRADARVIIQFNLIGLTLFTVSLVLVVGLLTYAIARGKRGEVETDVRRSVGVVGVVARNVTVEPPWGLLEFNDIEIEPPEEYIAFDLEHAPESTWTFEGMTEGTVRALLSECGIESNTVTRLLSPPSATISGSNITVKPDDGTLIALSPEGRAQLYRALSQNRSTSQFIRFPVQFTHETFEASFRNGQVPSALAEMVRGLLYSRGEFLCFSDYELLLRRIRSEPQGVSCIKALSRQTAVLGQLRVTPKSDIDRILGYWGKGIEMKDIRPLLESVKREPDGGTISLIYLLPQFARQRLYTYPVPSQEGDPAIDCHWSSMNFFNEIPDERFSDPQYTTAFLKTNYYRVAKPNVYGDTILFVDDRSVAEHSAIYLAEDIVFTKNGNNCARPWVLMRLKDLMDQYSVSGMHVVVFRRKNA